MNIRRKPSIYVHWGVQHIAYGMGDGCYLVGRSDMRFQTFYGLELFQHTVYNFSCR